MVILSLLAFTASLILGIFFLIIGVMIPASPVQKTTLVVIGFILLAIADRMFIEVMK